MNYPHRGSHCRNRRCDNNSFRPEVGSTDFYIIDIFQHKLQFGEIERVDIIHKNKYDNHHLKKVFIHFKKWNHYSDSAEHVRRRLLDDHIIKVVYDNYKFWKCSASRAKYVIYN